MKTPVRVQLTQCDLFQSQPMRPMWRSLPPETQNRVLELLIQLLRNQQRSRVPAAPQGKEAGDE